MTSRLCCRRTVVDDPDLAEFAARNHNLIELRVVIDPVHVSPIFAVTSAEVSRGDVIEVDQLGMIGDACWTNPVALRDVKLLDEVVPDVPLPDDAAASID